MKKETSKSEAKKKIDFLFQQHSFSPEDISSIKRLAMKHRIKLGCYKKSFCKKCLSQLKGKIRISQRYKIVECSVCNCKNKFSLNFKEFF